MSKFYAVSGQYTDRSYFSSVVLANSPRDAKTKVQPKIVKEFLAVDELNETITPLNSSKAVCVARQEKQVLTVSFVMQNINPSDRSNLITDLDELIRKYRLSVN